MVILITNLKAFCVTALSVCLGLVMFGSGLHAQPQEVKSNTTDEQRRAEEEATGQQQQEQQPSADAKDRPVSINKRPLKDWLKKTEELRRQGHLDFDNYFSLVVTADRLSSGELTNLNVESYEGDPQLVESANRLIAALSDGRMFSIFEDVDRVVLKLSLNESVALFNASLEAASPEQAKQLANGHRALLDAGHMLKRGQTEAIFYDHTKVSANGKQVIFTITIPRQILGELLDIKPSAP